MKKLKKIQLRIEKEVISNLNHDGLTNVKGGTFPPLPSALSEECKETDESDCCTFNSYCLCQTKNVGACVGASLGHGAVGNNCASKPGTSIEPYTTGVIVMTQNGCGVAVYSEQGNCEYKTGNFIPTSGIC